MQNRGVESQLRGFNTYLEGILNDVEHKASIRNSTDMLSMISIVADLSLLSDETSLNIDLSSIRGALPQQEMQEKFVDGMQKMMKTAEKYCPQCGRKIKPDQTIYNVPQESDHELEKKREHGMIEKSKKWRKQYHVEQAISPGV